MTKIDLNVADDRVWAYICDLAREPFLTRREIRCDQCQGSLGRAATTKLGPIFVSSWTTDTPVSIGYIVGNRLLPHNEAARRHKTERKKYLTSQSGDAQSTRDGLFAALAIPANLPQTYAPLYVSCDRHGDTIIERQELLAASRLKEKKPHKVTVSKPFLEYIPQRKDGFKVIKTSSVEERRYGSATFTPAEFDAWWASDSQ